jgi:hypothetical protein
MATEAWLQDTATAFEHYPAIPTFELGVYKDAELKNTLF